VLEIDNSWKSYTCFSVDYLKKTQYTTTTTTTTTTTMAIIQDNLH